MKITKILLSIALPFVLLSSCKKAATSSADMQYQLQAINPSATVNRTVGIATIQWTSGSASATEIKLEGKNNNGSEVEFKSQNPQQIDVFASVAATLGNISIPAGTYSEVEFKIELNQNGSNAALELNGQFTNAARIITPVIFRVNTLLEIKAEQNNVTINDNSSTTALTTLDLSVLTAGITQTMLNAATVTGGTIIISSSVNSNLYNIIVANLGQQHEVEVHH